MPKDNVTATPTDNSPRIEIWEEKNMPLLVLNPGSQYPFKIGVSKAKKILENIEVIQKFVDSNGVSLD